MVFGKLKDKIQAAKSSGSASSGSGGSDLATAAYPPNKREIYKARVQEGVNLGGWFCLEKWLAPAMYSSFKDDNGGDDSEYAAVSASVREQGVDKTREKWEKHWDSFVTEEDFKWLADKHVNAVRVPMGYWTLGEKFVGGTPFAENRVAEVYRSAWEKYKKMISTAGNHGIAVLVDMHGVPGGANGDSHSGVKGGGKFFENSKLVAQAVDALAFVAEQVKSFDNIVGIQIVNEAAWDSKTDEYYNSAIRRIREIDAGQYVYISDAWNRSKYVEFAKSRPGVVVDTHVYRCFSDEDCKKSAEQLIKDVREKEALDSHCVVGEYSCTLSGSSWDKGGDRDKLKREYGQTQIDVFARSAAGSFFWTYKFAEGRGGEWDFREMYDHGSIAPPKRSGRKASSDDADKRAKDATASHEKYWSEHAQGKKMDHARYESGFKIGWQDAAAFWALDESKIGARDGWKLMRTNDHTGQNGQSEFVWEFEQGLDAGVKAFEESVK
ncbi:glycoside hydrolase superfamily [Myxozyma melibiosi]|uniref:Glycoside hydrolase superfamily n=1 Tax=Myxozyma melibiosi TaxID=54550 RepID=A0ABR1F196_9ASCO